MVEYRFGWRDRDKYVADPKDRMWLEEFSRESARYADMLFLVEAMAGYFQRLARQVAGMAKVKKVGPKKPNLKAKDRRRLERLNV
jgi:hypothetical protein